MVYTFWREALKYPAKIGTEDLPIHDGHPQAGFYRMRDGDDMAAIAIWPNKEGKMVAKRNHQMLKHAEDVWTFCCRSPIEEEVYRGVIAGGAWPDDAPINEVVRGMGDNLPDDPFEALTLEYQGEVEIARDLMKSPVRDQDHADKVANFAKRVSAISTNAENLFKVEKQPFLEGGRAVDDKWRSLREGAKVLASQLKRHIDDWLAEQKRVEQERQRKAQAEADALRRKAEEAAAKVANEQSNPDDPEQEAAKAEADKLAAAAAKAEREAKEKAVSAGRTGSKVSMRTFKSAKITDYDKLVMALKDRDEMKELVQSLANRAARSDYPLEGMEIITEERAV